MARRNTQSLVLICPSTEMRLNVRPTSRASRLRATPDSRPASVVTTQSMVAMPGAIMPAPLAAPASRTTPSRVVTSKAHCLAKRSVVMMLSAKAGPPSGPSEAAAAAIPAVARAGSSGTPMMPVEPTATRAGVVPSASAHARCMSRATARPGPPVQAFAFPLFITTAASERSETSRRLTSTGAAAKELRVKTAAPAVSARCSAATATMPRSLRPLSLMPAATPGGHEASGVGHAGRDAARLLQPHAGGQREERRGLRVPDDRMVGSHRPAHLRTSSPVVSGSPTIRFMFCTACPEAPFIRLSMAEITLIIPALLSRRSAMRQAFVPCTSRRLGVGPTTSTKGSPS